MNLPALGTQMLALTLGWAIVLACLAAELAAIVLRPRMAVTASSLVARRGSLLVALAASLGFACAWLPGETSPVFWLGLAFQWPSTLLVLLAAARLLRRVTGIAAHRRRFDPATLEPLLPFWPALCLVVAGGLLYAGTIGWLPDLYRSGFQDTAVLAGATIAIVAWRLLKLRTGWLGPFVALSLLLHLLLRLPTGNAWDAVLDPFVFVIAVAAVLRGPGQAAVPTFGA